jgi:hypothetical protein
VPLEDPEAGKLSRPSAVLSDEARSVEPLPLTKSELLVPLPFVPPMAETVPAPALGDELPVLVEASGDELLKFHWAPIPGHAVVVAVALP